MGRSDFFEEHNSGDEVEILRCTGNWTTATIESTGTDENGKYFSVVWIQDGVEWRKQVYKEDMRKIRLECNTIRQRKKEKIIMFQPRRLGMRVIGNQVAEVYEDTQAMLKGICVGWIIKKVN